MVTISYCPPEIIDIYGKREKYPFDEKFDIWGFGVILYEMAFGKELYSDKNAFLVRGEMDKMFEDWDAKIP